MTTIYIKVTDTTRMNFFADAAGTTPTNADFSESGTDSIEFKRCTGETWTFLGIAFSQLQRTNPGNSETSTSLSAYASPSLIYPPKSSPTPFCSTYAAYNNGWEELVSSDFSLDSANSSTTRLTVNDSDTVQEAYEYYIYISISESAYVADPQIYNPAGG